MLLQAVAMHIQPVVQGRKLAMLLQLVLLRCSSVFELLPAGLRVC